jgi:hypothetical protein
MTNNENELPNLFQQGLNRALSTTQAVAFCDQFHDQQGMNLITLNYWQSLNLILPSGALQGYGVPSGSVGMASGLNHLEPRSFPQLAYTTFP